MSSSTELFIYVNVFVSCLCYLMCSTFYCQQAVIEAKLELAQRVEENEILHLEYLNMEKYACKLKLQLAVEGANKIH